MMREMMWKTQLFPNSPDVSTVFHHYLWSRRTQDFDDRIKGNSKQLYFPLYLSCKVSDSSFLNSPEWDLLMAFAE